MSWAEYWNFHWKSLQIELVVIAVMILILLPVFAWLRQRDK